MRTVSGVGLATHVPVQGTCVHLEWQPVTPKWCVKVRPSGKRSGDACGSCQASVHSGTCRRCLRHAGIACAGAAHGEGGHGALLLRTSSAAGRRSMSAGAVSTQPRRGCMHTGGHRTAESSVRWFPCHGCGQRCVRAAGGWWIHGCWCVKNTKALPVVPWLHAPPAPRLGRQRHQH